MSAERFTDNDYELLSAYIDGMLNAAERSALEARLERETELRRELATLRQTVALVNDLPSVKAPRDFTLTPAMTTGIDRARTPAPPPRRVLRFPILSALSTAAATVLMVAGVLLILTGDDASTGADVVMREAPVAAAPTAEAQAEEPQAGTMRTAPSPEPERDSADEAEDEAEDEAADAPPPAAMEMAESAAAEESQPEQAGDMSPAVGGGAAPSAPADDESTAGDTGNMDTFNAEAETGLSEATESAGNSAAAPADEALPADDIATINTADRQTGALLVMIGATLLMVIGLANLIMRVVQRRRA